MRVRSVLALLLFLPCSLLAATSPLEEQIAEYQVQYGSFTLGQARFILDAPQQQTYHFHMDSDLSLLLLSDKRNISSDFMDDHGQLLPLQFHHERTGAGTNFTEQIGFSRDARKIFSIYKGNKAQLDYHTPIYDAMTIQLQFRLDLAAGKQEFHYRMVKDNEIDDYRFRNLGPEKLQLAGHEYDTIKLEVARKSTKRSTVVWMAPELGYLPIRFIHQEKGSTMQLDLLRYRFGSTTFEDKLAEVK